MSVSAAGRFVKIYGIKCENVNAKKSSFTLLLLLLDKLDPDEKALRSCNTTNLDLGKFFSAN